MNKLLFLPHRIPFPPNKGDKIRSFHLLKYLAGHYEVFMGTFIDNPSDWQYVEEVKKFCKAAHFRNLSPARAKLRSISGFFTGEPLTIPYYRNAEMKKWINEVVEFEDIDRILVFSSSMAQYVTRWVSDKRRIVIDFVDVDSDKWKQYSKSKSWPLSYIYAREAETLFHYENYIASVFDKSLFVSESEANMFKGLSRENSDKIGFVNNGVDTGYFSTSHDLKSPYPKDGPVIVFTGAMDYWANAESVTWFSSEVFPLIREYHPAASFYIVGSNPNEAVKKLEKLPGIHVTGAVHDIRPYIAYADTVVAPMRIARGVQNKVLEAMAMSKIIVVTPQGLDGINARHGEELFVEDDAVRFADRVVDIIENGPGINMQKNAREFVEKNYSWEKNLDYLHELVETKA